MKDWSRYNEQIARSREGVTVSNNPSAMQEVDWEKKKPGDIMAMFGAVRG